MSAFQRLLRPLLLLIVIISPVLAINFGYAFLEQRQQHWHRADTEYRISQDLESLAAGYSFSTQMKEFSSSNSRFESIP